MVSTCTSRWPESNADFFVSCGDNVYYDSDDPVVNSAAVARYHWQRMYSMATLRKCLRNLPGYWQKDDHDVYSDDCYPGMQTPKMCPFSLLKGSGCSGNKFPRRLKKRRCTAVFDGERKWRSGYLKLVIIALPIPSRTDPNKTHLGSRSEAVAGGDARQQPSAMEVRNKSEPRHRAGSRTQAGQPCQSHVCQRRSRLPAMAEDQR